MKIISTALLLLTFSLSLSAQGYRVNRTEEKKKVKIKQEEYGKNIISFSPVQLIATDLNVKPDIAVAFSYERILQNELISVRLPFSASLYNGYFYCMPTIKLYPKKQGIVKYAIGPQFLFGTGEAERTVWVQSGFGSGYEKIEKGTRTQLGFLLNNSVNFTVAKSIYAGMDVSVGLKYIDNMPNVNNSDVVFFPIGGGGSGVLSQSLLLGFNMGYRF